MRYASGRMTKYRNVTINLYVQTFWCKNMLITVFTTLMYILELFFSNNTGKNTVFGAQDQTINNCHYNAADTTS